MSFFRPRYRNLLLLAAVLAPALAHAAPYTTTRYIRIDLKTDTGYSYDENFNRLPDSPQRPGASQETLPEGVTRWFLGADVDVIKRHPDGRLEVVSHKPAYSQLPHHYIFTYQTSSRPAKDECGILPLAVGRDLLDLRFPAGYAFAMKGGTLGGLDFHWTNSANVPETEELYVRFNMHWDEGTTRYRDFNITWVGLNPCREEVVIPTGTHVVNGPKHTLGEAARIIEVAPHVMDHADYLDVRINNHKAYRFEPTYASNPAAHYGAGEGAPTVPLHVHPKHIPQNGAPIWMPGIYGPKVAGDDVITARLSVTNPHKQPIENSGILLVFWEPLNADVITDKFSPDPDTEQ
ncbi:hypothetical protein [Duganella sp. HH105]|uniref:hypothetical protein n=1 Tax=Duganella sp. HH105 TaxID=1781067 RepID=UPI000877D011|nr:hypothetical protein [Duganella sp. HH105]OEZ54733.1 hypothetical protein DUGA6_56870 [Duganella sp. HH105]